MYGIQFEGHTPSASACLMPETGRVTPCARITFSPISTNFRTLTECASGQLLSFCRSCACGRRRILARARLAVGSWAEAGGRPWFPCSGACKSPRKPWPRNLVAFTDDRVSAGRAPVVWISRLLRREFLGEYGGE